MAQPVSCYRKQTNKQNTGHIITSPMYYNGPVSRLVVVVCYLTCCAKCSSVREPRTCLWTSRQLPWEWVHGTKSHQQNSSEVTCMEWLPSVSPKGGRYSKTHLSFCWHFHVFSVSPVPAFLPHSQIPLSIPLKQLWRSCVLFSQGVFFEH